MTLSDFSLTLSQEKKKCKVTLYDKVGKHSYYNTVLESSVISRCNAMSRCNSYKLINENIVTK